MRKTISFTIIALLLLLLPRQASFSTAADCYGYACNYGAMQSGYNSQTYTPPPVRLPQPPITPTRNSPLTLTSNQAYCVGQTPSYSISATPNASAIWTSWFNGRQNNQLTLTLNSSGNFTGSGNMWQSSDIGQWTKQVTVNGQSQSLQFIVSSCNNNSSSNQTNQNSNVSIRDNLFTPNTVTVAAGTTVQWTNMGRMMHTVTADSGSFDSGTLNPGSSFSQMFATPGTYRYYCRFHGGRGGVGMSGIIVVTANNSTLSNPNPSSGNTNSGNTYYDPYNNNLFGSTNNNYSGNSTNGNSYYDPYNNNLLNPINNNSNTYYDPYNNNLLGTGNQNANNYYDPYGVVPCISYACPGNAVGFP